MKTYPCSTGNVMSRRTGNSLRRFLLLIFFISTTIVSFAGGGGGLLNFRNSVLDSGVDKLDGAVYRFPQVTSEVDALVKIKARSNSLVYLVTIDMLTSGFDKAWQPQVGYNNGTAPGAADWWMEFEITFVKKETNTPVTIDQFDLSAIDIDGNGDQIREYVSFYGLKSYKLEENSLLVLSDITSILNGLTSLLGKRFDGPTVNYTNIDTSGTSVMTTATYINTQTYTLRVGGVSTGVSGASDRMYSLYFQDFKYTSPQQVTLPVKLKSFDARLSSGKAYLNWVAASELEFSHYIVERSFDGKDYSDATMIFASDKNYTDVHYAYNETVGNTKGLIYYRLKMVDKDGAFKYSMVRMIRVNTNGDNISVTAYPNPVAAELRITIPTAWQDQKVTYDMFTASGKIVKRYVTDHASQTETLNMGNLTAGSYLIRLTSGNESAVQQIVKSR